MSPIRIVLRKKFVGKVCLTEFGAKPTKVDASSSQENF